MCCERCLSRSIVTGKSINEVAHDVTEQPLLDLFLDGADVVRNLPSLVHHNLLSQDEARGILTRMGLLLRDLDNGKCAS